MIFTLSAYTTRAITTVVNFCLAFYKKSILITLTLLIACAPCTWAYTLYVATNGSDKFSGTLAKPNVNNTDGPFATLDAARNAVRKLKQSKPNEPVIVNILQGTYYLSKPFVLLPQDSGTSAAPVTYRALGTGAVFIGGVPISNFKLKNGLWIAELPALLAKQGFEQLYVNGTRAVRAKSPNHGFFTPKKVIETEIEKGKDRVAAKATQQIYLRSNEADWLKSIKKEEADKVVLTFYHKWDNTRKYVNDLNLNDSSILISGQGMKSWNPLNDKTQFIAENFMAALDTVGEWYLEPSGKLYYKPYPEQRIQNTIAYAPVTQQLLVVKGSSGDKVSHVSFENITFKVSGYQLPYKGQEPVQAAAPVEAAVMLDYAEHVNFTNCEIANTGANGIWYREGCNNSSVSGCYFHDLGAGGVKLGALNINKDSAAITQYITIDNNIIHSGGYVFPCAAGIAVFHSADNKITHNEVADFRYTGISVGWVWGYKHSVTRNNTISFNHIHHLGWGELSDMGGIYTLGPSPGTHITNNVIHHIYSRTYGGWGLYTDEGSSDILLENNLVYETKSAGFHQHYGKNNIVRNNIFAMGIESQLQMSKAEAHQSFTLKHNIIYYKQGELFKTNAKKYWENAITAVDSNIYWNAAARQPNFPLGGLNEWKNSGHDQHSYIADPAFVDAEHYKFQIRNMELIKKIDFKPFDYNKAGVYGSKVWLGKAKLPASTEVAFNKLMLSTNKVFSEH